MWIDVISKEGRKRKDSRWDFTVFTVELFPRKTKPVYPDIDDFLFISIIGTSINTKNPDNFPVCIGPIEIPCESLDLRLAS